MLFEPSYQRVHFRAQRPEALPQAAAHTMPALASGERFGLLALHEEVPTNWAELVEQRLREDWNVPHWLRMSVPAWHDGETWVRNGLGGTALVGSLSVTQARAHSLRSYDDLALSTLGQFEAPARMAFFQAAANTPFLTSRVTKVQAMSEAHLLGALGSPSEAPSASLLELAPTPPLAIAQMRSYAPLGSWHEISAAEGNQVLAIDGRPALEVLLEEAGQLLARRPDQLPERILVGFPAGGELGPHAAVQARRLTGMGRTRGVFSISDEAVRGMPICFCRRDAGLAQEEAVRVLSDLASRLDTQPRMGLLFSQAGRNQGFMPEGDDMALVRNHLGTDFPLFAVETWGQVEHSRLYTESSLLALFI